MNKKQAGRAGEALVASGNLNGVLNHKQNVGRKLRRKWKDSPAICKCSWPAFSLPVGRPAQLENKPVSGVSPERFMKTRFKDHCTSGLELYPLSSGKVNRTVGPGQLFTWSHFIKKIPEGSCGGQSNRPPQWHPGPNTWTNEYVTLYGKGAFPVWLNKCPWLGEINLNYPNGPDLITQVFKSTKRRDPFPVTVRGRYEYRQTAKEIQHWGPEDRGGVVINQGSPGASRRQGMESPLEPPRMF